MTRSERDLVAALRAELAAIDPSRRVRPASRGGRARARAAAREPAGRAARGPAATDDAPRIAAAAGARSTGRRRRALPLAWLRGLFLARGSLSLAGGRTHLEFVVPPDEAPVLAARLADVGLPGIVARPPRPRRRHLEERRHGRHVPAPDRRGSALLELEARQVARALRGDLNRVLNAESANLQRAVGAAGRQLAAIDVARGRRPARRRSRTSSALVAAARRETPEATLASSRSASSSIARRSSARSSGIERLASTTTPDAGRRAAEAAARRRSGMIRRRCAPSSSPPTGRCTPRRPMPASSPRPSPRRTREPGVTRVDLPAVRVPGGRPRRARGGGPGRRGRRPERPSRGRRRVHRRDLGRRCSSGSRRGSSSATRSAAATPARPTS